MATADGSSGGTGSPGSGDVTLDPDHVNEIAAQVGRQTREITRVALAATSVPPGGFGGSGAAGVLDAAYRAAHGHSVAQNTEAETMLADYEVGLRGAVQDQLDADSLNAAALVRISAIDPGRA